MIGGFAPMAGQVVMGGFIRIRMSAVARRLLMRMIAILPAIVVTTLYGEGQPGKLLTLSQVVLSQ